MRIEWELAFRGVKARSEPSDLALMLRALPHLTDTLRSLAVPHRSIRSILLAALVCALPAHALAVPIISEVFLNPVGPNDGRQWIEIYNPDAVAVDLSSYSFGWGGADYTFGTLQLVGILAPGGTFVVGGPISDATNANPVYDQVANFSPDLQIPFPFFAAADGIALFDVTAATITPATVPIDTLIYGGTFFSSNSNGLIDSTGAPGTVAYTLPFFGAGTSIEFDGTGWGTQAAPTPGSVSAGVPEPSTAVLLLLGCAAMAVPTRRRC